MEINLFAYLLEASVCLMAFYLFYRQMLEKEPQFSRNWFYLLITSGVSLLVPLLDLSDYRPVSMPENYLTALPILSFEQASPEMVAAKPLPAWHLTDYLFHAYIAGVTLFAAVFIGRLGKLAFLIRKSIRERKQEYVLVEVPGLDAPFSFLHYIFWDKHQPLNQIEQQPIIEHELAHVRSRHSLDILYIEIMCVFVWFNPVVYLYKKALQEQHEFAADRSVLQQHDLQQYTRLLVTHTLRTLNLPITHNFNHSFIKKRIMMMNQPNSGKSGWLKVAFVLPLFTLLFFMFALEGCSKEIIRPGNTVVADTSKLIKQPTVGVFFHVNGQLKEFNYYRNSLNMNEFPDALDMRAIAHPTHQTIEPSDARFRISEFDVSIVRNKKIVKRITARENVVSLKELREAAKPGDYLVISVKQAQQLTKDNQIVTVRPIGDDTFITQVQ